MYIACSKGQIKTLNTVLKKLKTAYASPVNLILIGMIKKKKTDCARVLVYSRSNRLFTRSQSKTVQTEMCNNK